MNQPLPDVVVRLIAQQCIEIAVLRQQVAEAGLLRQELMQLRQQLADHAAPLQPARMDVPEAAAVPANGAMLAQDNGVTEEAR